MKPSLTFPFLLASILFAQDAPFDATRLVPTTLATKLDRPMELEVAPDGRIFYIELDGRLKILHPYTRETTLAGEIKVTTSQENGLIGMALDPAFAQNNWIYLTYSPPDFEGQHISRFSMQGDHLDLASEKLLLKFKEQRLECCHHAGSMEFGPDGCLFISAGDNTHPAGDSRGYAPIDERPGRMPWDAQKSASNKFSHNGKVLRIRPLQDGTYEIPDGNLFPKDGSQGLPEIYVMGCRNPWRINVDQKTGTLYWGEVGPDAGGDSDLGPAGHDEINQARKAGNFGWPYFVGPNLAYPMVNFETRAIGEKHDPLKPVNRSPNSTGVQTLPPAQPAFIYYKRDLTPDFPMLRTGGRTACAGPVFHFDNALGSDTQLHPHYDNCLFIYEWSRHWVFAVRLDENENIASLEEFMPDYPFSRPIDIDFGPEGAMYLIEYGETWGKNDNCQLIRIDYLRGNRAPHGHISGENLAGKAPLSVRLSSEGSFDPDEGDQLRYEWKVVPGEDKVVSTKPNPTLTFPNPGNFQAVLSIKDQHGAAHLSSIPVSVGNARPVVKVISPRDGDFFRFGKPVEWDIEVTDEEDQKIEGKRIHIASQVVKSSLPDAPSRIDLATGMSPGLELMKKSDCFNCHTIDRKLVGPAYLDISQKYAKEPAGWKTAAEHILKGSTGVWGPIPMMPHPQHNEEQAGQMVAWIASIAAGQEDPLSGPKGSFVPQRPKNLRPQDPATLLVEASYLDSGAFPIAPLSASQTVKLRNSLVPANSADEYHRVQRTSQGIGSVGHDGHILFKSLNLARIKKAVIRISSGGPGGTVEFRLNTPDGSVLGQTQVEPKGDWGKYYNQSLAITPLDTPGDLYIRFVNPGVGNGILNLESIEFQ
jgi:cytochrome c